MSRPDASSPDRQLSDNVAQTIELDAKAARVCDMLDRWADRLAGHLADARIAKRCNFRSPLIALIPPKEASASPSSEWSAISITARNISTAGMSFICPEFLSADSLVVCLDEKTTVQGKIVRRRRVHDGFWEYGVEFVGRSDPADDS